MEISQVIRRVLYRFPLFGNVIVNLNFIHTDEAVPAPIFTDGSAIYYKDEFWSYTSLEQEFLIAHEILHIVLRHFFRNLDKDEELLNYVEDGIINQILMKSGLPMPDGCVDIPDALDYSVEELYLRYLPKIDEIKSWMRNNTYHLEITFGNQFINKIVSEAVTSGLSGGLNQQIHDMLDENDELRNELLQDYKESLKTAAEIAKAGKGTTGMVEESEPVGKASPLVSWKDLLVASLVSPEDSVVSFIEVEPDGIFRREERNIPGFSECEIIIDSSGSMSLAKIKAFLRECKNILGNSRIKVGFCDTAFYGWHEIRSEMDIDNLQIPGHGGTSFQVMANTFTRSADNKLVLTDGGDIFPSDRPDILWVVMSYWAAYLEERADNQPDLNVIYIDEREIEVPTVKKICSYN